MDAILVMRLRKCGDAMPLAPPAVLLAPNVELGVVQERVGEPLKGEEEDMNGEIGFRNDYLHAQQETDVQSTTTTKSTFKNIRQITYLPHFSQWRPLKRVTKPESTEVSIELPIAGLDYPSCKSI